MRKIIGNLIIGMGILSFLGAFLLFSYNKLDDIRAERAAASVAEQLEPYRNDPDYPEDREEDSEEGEDSDGTDNSADSETYMREVVIDGIGYIGSLQIPVLGLELPVISRWNYDYLRIAPCRYTGSIEFGNMVIAAHNYTRHFGELPLLQLGTQIVFVDMNNNQFFFEIKESEVLQPTQVEEMIESEYDLTLFTCVYGGSARYAIRCNMIEE